MITEGIEKALENIVEQAMFQGMESAELNVEMRDDKVKQLKTLVKAEAINLADRIIGKDHVIKGETDLKEGVAKLDPADKAVFDFQVKQRVELAKYQNPPSPTDPEDMINDNLAPNEA